MKILKFDLEAKEKLLKGVKELSHAVSDTLGPLGNNVAIAQKWGLPKVIHDGVKVAKEIELVDQFENMGAQLVKDAAEKTNDTAGDGTTTAIILAEEMVSKGFDLLKKGVNARKLRKGIDMATGYVTDQIKKRTKKITYGPALLQIASLSAQDPEIGKIVAEAMKMTGENGVVAVDEGRGLDISVDYKEGMEFDKGYISPYFVTNGERMEAEVKEPYILVTDKRISTAAEIVPFLDLVIKKSKDVIIIAEDIAAEALATLVINRLQGRINAIGIKAPGFTDAKPELLVDIATVCGATVISDTTGKKLEEITLEDCGRADKVWSDKESTRIIGGKGTTVKIEARIKQIKSQLNKSKSEFEKEKLRERLAKLDAGVAVINVGAATEIALAEKKEMVNDAVAATKAALSEGIVPGGGTTLLRIAEKFTLKDKDEAVQKGIDLVRDSLTKPFVKLMRNSGIEPSGADVQVIIENEGIGIDVVDGQQKELIKEGIIDPAMVVKETVKNAASVAGMILTTNVLICEEKEKEEK